ncbi:MAG: prolyl oligopeptidase family serine peptidase, partial [Defluviitaleaceae bacterium]|nr:prolyl oligopeptidase family serine peptidase [Defluviitaleaceae bacterium]
MKKIIALTAFIVVLVLSACSDDIYERQFEGLTFAEARSGFTTSLTRNNTNDFAIPTPPQGVFDLVHFTSPVGSLAAYVSSDPGDGQQHPLIIWVVGGWSNGISEFPWSYGDWDNDQSAAAFREAGILMMYPSFRGANGNPGYFESLFGEIDDIVAAFEFAAALPYVDSSRIYLGGHSTGGTRVLLASAYTDVFRAVFSFGPVDDIAEHNQTQFTFNLREAAERELRSPIHWLDDISSPTFIIEGAGGNADAIRNMDRATTNANVHPFVVPGGDHFDILAPITRLAAQKILDDTGDTVNISITLQELQSAMEQPPISSMPVMVSHTNTDAGVSFLLPFIWELDVRGEWSFSYTSPFFDDNFWE